MTAHVQVKPSGREFFVDGSDSLMDAITGAASGADKDPRFPHAPEGWTPAAALAAAPSVFS